MDGLIGEKSGEDEVVLEFIPLIAVQPARIRSVKKEKSCYHHFGNKKPFNISPKGKTKFTAVAEKEKCESPTENKKAGYPAFFIHFIEFEL